MKFCQSHWDQLRQRIDDRGLSHLVAKDGRKAISQLAEQLQERQDTARTFDPLMAAHWAIANNVMRFLGPKYEGRAWPRCPTKARELRLAGAPS